MKTKTILKTLAVALLMPAMLLTTACSNEDDIVNNENTIKKGFELPVTVNVTRQDDGTTRATYNDGTKKLSFSTGDQLFVFGSADLTAGIFQGTLTWQSGGTFSGTLTTENSYDGTAQALLESADYAGARLLPADYDDYDYFYFDPVNGFLDTDDTKAFATSKATAVAQFSLEEAKEYSSGFALKPRNAILNFTISGLTPGSHNVEVYGIGGAVTANGSGVATFAVGVGGGTYSEYINLDVDGNYFDLDLYGGTSTELVAGKIYNITRAVPAATSLSELKTAINGGTDCSSYIGWEVNSEGAIAKSGVSGTKIGNVAYVSTSDVDANVSGSRILVIASADAGTNLQWGSKGTARGLEAVNNANDLKGYSNTNTLQGYGSEAHPAAYAAWNYSATIPSGGATPAHWFMPTMKQWKNMRDAKGGTYGAMATAYGISGHYWTSSEFFNGTNYEECKNNAWRFVTNSNFQGNMKSLNFNVRSIFAY